MNLAVRRSSFRPMPCRPEMPVGDNHRAPIPVRIALLAARSSIHTVRWANALAERGHEVHLISSHQGGDHLLEGVTTHYLPFPAPLGYGANAVFLRRILRRLRPELLHAHFASGYGTLGNLSRYRPFVLSVWGTDVYEFPGKSFLHRRIVASNLRSADWVCSTSQVMAAQTRKVTPIERLTVVPFGIDVERFSPNASDSDVITIGTVKTLAPKYGIDILLRAFAEVRRTVSERSPGPSHRLRLLIVGGGPDRGKLQALAEELGLADCSEFIGPVPHSAVPDWLNRLDVYVAASRLDSESFGVAPLEASACAVPVVVSDVGGLPEVVRSGTTGIIVERENVIATAGAILRLVENKALRRKMGEAGRRHVLEHYQWSSNIESMEAVYHDVLSRPRI
jgi:L-malate glycosyltransferase